MSNLALTEVATKVADRVVLRIISQVEDNLLTLEGLEDTIHRDIVSAYVGGYNLHKEVVEQGRRDASCPATVDIDFSEITKEQVAALVEIGEDIRIKQVSNFHQMGGAPVPPEHLEDGFVAKRMVEAFTLHNPTLSYDKIHKLPVEEKEAFLKTLEKVRMI